MLPALEEAEGSWNVRTRSTRRWGGDGHIVLSFPGVGAGHAVRLRELADVGCAVTIERETGGDERCIIASRGRRVIGTGATADAAAADALERWSADPG